MAGLSDSLGADFLISFINFVRDGKSERIIYSPIAKVYEESFSSRGYSTLEPPYGFGKYVNDWHEVLGDVPYMGHFNKLGYGQYVPDIVEKILEIVEKDSDPDTS